MSALEKDLIRDLRKQGAVYIMRSGERRGIWNLLALMPERTYDTYEWYAFAVRNRCVKLNTKLLPNTICCLAWKEKGKWQFEVL